MPPRQPSLTGQLTGRNTDRGTLVPGPGRDTGRLSCGLFRA
jgi:hypothetical protein